MIELLEKYPKTAKLVREYYLEKLVEGLKAELPQEFKDHVKQQGITNETVGKILEENPYNLVYFFDKNTKYISIFVSSRGIGAVDFSFSINGTFKSDKTLNNRLSCEKEAITKAFELLESTLNG